MHFWYFYNGKYYSHILNPLDGYPINHNTVSVSVIADNCLIADAYATGLLVMGKEKGLDFVNKNNSIEAIFISGNPDSYSIDYSNGYNHLRSDIAFEWAYFLLNCSAITWFRNTSTRPL